MATIVEFQTSQGSFQVNLFDQTTPKTVENFMKYVNADRYQDVIFHRSEPNFVLQGGGFFYEGSIPLSQVESFGNVDNEPVYSNVRGTIAMAKLGGDPNSASSQWFFNLKDNSVNLDVQNGGFTVFGQVIGDGMDIVDKIAKLDRCGSIPLVDYSQEKCADDQVNPDESNFITINAVTIIDDSENTAENLEPKKNTLLTTTNPDTGNNNSESSSGSLFSMLMLLGAGLFVRRKR
ncbi:peptidylprolyl isomerase [Pseudoalteromonas phenolica]|uniref:Peptidyl-prolyl cis-trans isomerase n=2 Tax=Pseudoalteromonas phenolica TaxID=161398 RepID=A0A5R9Q2Z1_9GAMM|nr:peptidylprolyl isomerase [Pseudoalteromonas phenolica]TLX47528.1 peptidylprolyl isomerase [Pseudoalteromonas phenolica]